MKTITIRLPAVEAAMLAELQKHNRLYRDLNGFLLVHIKEVYQKTIKERKL